MESLRRGGPGARLWRAEELYEQLPGAAGAFLREHNQFGLAHRIADEAFGVQPREGVPIVALLGSRQLAFALGEAGEMAQGENGIVNFVEIRFHGNLKFGV